MRNSNFQHQPIRARQVNPLRKVIRDYVTDIGFREDLECGHTIVPPADKFGEAPRPASRRRCYYCGIRPDPATKDELGR